MPSKAARSVRSTIRRGAIRRVYDPASVGDDPLVECTERRRGASRGKPLMQNDRWDLTGENAYTVLGVRHDADDADIAAAYRSLARVYHPDVVGEGGNARMSRINAAWDRLRDTRRRDAYDRELGIYPV